MKFTTSVLSGLALCAVNVAAQDFGSLPTCAQGCATNAIPASCGLDVKCICSTSSFITSVSCCVATACDAADQQTTLQFAEQLCAGAGITNLPSAAGCSATGAATASTGTSTATAGTTSKASAASTAVTSAKTSASAVSDSAATSGKTTTATGTASSSASSTSHSGAATPLAKGNGVAAAGAGAAALLAAIFV